MHLKKSFLLIFFSAIALTCLAQYSQDSAWIRENYVKKEVYITMRDGTRLFTSILAPKDTTVKHPILLTRTPYSCAPYGEDKFPSYWNSYYRYYLREGYIMVKQDVRGRWMSEGQFVDVRPFNTEKKTDKEIDEASDTYDAIDWMVKNIAGNNGNVGVFGISYPGFYSTMAALSGHPALKAVSPQAPVTEWFIGDDFHHNGAFFQMDAFAFYSSFGKPRPQPTTAGPAPFNFQSSDNYLFFLQNSPLSKLTKLMGDSIAFWKDLMTHPDYDTFWKARNTRNFVTNVKPAMLIVGGLFDAEDCFGAWNLYKAIETRSPSTNNRIVMGPWYHGQWASSDGSHLGYVNFHSNTSFWYQNNIELPFFNYYLKENRVAPKLAEATVFFSGANQWKEFNAWPPSNTENRSLYFHSGGKLSWTKPSGSNQFTEYTSDPSKPVPYSEDVHLGRTAEYMIDDQRFASRRPDVLTFETEILNEDITLAGAVVADLITSISTTDADFVVKLVDVFPNEYKDSMITHSYPMGGFQMLVRGEIFRGKYRNSFEKPAPFVPNKIDRVKFSLPDVAHTFKKGHRIMVQVQSSWFPLVDRNPQQFVNIYEAKENDFRKSLIRIFHDGSNASSIILPVIQ